MADALNVLITARKNCRICIDRNPGQIFNGSQEAFDPPVVSYWSQWLGHDTPKILIVGQDFGDIGYFRRYKGQDEPNNTTNNNLRALLAHAGLQVGEPPAKDHLSPVFLTNSILCLKGGAMNARIRIPWVKSCSALHLGPLVSHLDPPLVISMGSHAWTAAKGALKLDKAPALFRDAVGKLWMSETGRALFSVGHCGGLGLANRPMKVQVDDWKRVGQTLKDLGSLVL